MKSIDFESYYYKYKALKYYLKNNKIKGGGSDFAGKLQELLNNIITATESIRKNSLLIESSIAQKYFDKEQNRNQINNKIYNFDKQQKIIKEIHTQFQNDLQFADLEDKKFYKMRINLTILAIKMKIKDETFKIKKDNVEDTMAFIEKI